MEKDGKEGDLEKENREGTNTSGIRSGVLLSSHPSIFKSEACVIHHGSVVRTGKTVVKHQCWKALSQTASVTAALPCF
ncbi:hypothetical protein PAMP_010599 [Pampus punctatissimus]